MSGAREATQVRELVAAAIKLREILSLALMQTARTRTGALRSLHEHSAAEEPFESWLESLVEQTSAAWIMVGVLLRLSEDHGIAPYLAEPVDPHQVDLWLAQLAEILLPVKDDPAGALALPDSARHALVELFREDSSGAPRWREAVKARSFMARLYDGLAYGHREESALVSTPDFIAEFLAERTVEPAASEFGLEALRIMDPACGSGQLLIAAFRKLLELQRARGDTVNDQAAFMALGQLQGNDVSLFSCAATRCALIREYLEHVRTPARVLLGKLPLAIELRDSLLEFVRGDPSGRMSPGRYPVVLLEPPFIRESSRFRRELFRQRFESAHHNFSLSPIFLELALELATENGFVGALLDTAFSKREFGQPLIEKVLPRHELTCVVDASGAYLPGHSVPTLILLARRRPPQTEWVRVVFSQRGEPGTPSSPRAGKVWNEIRTHIDAAGFEGAFISVAEVPRSVLARHPWSLMTGATLQAANALQRSSTSTLEQLGVFKGGPVGGPGNLVAPPGAFLRHHLPKQELRLLIQSHGLGDWALSWIEPRALPDLPLRGAAPQMEQLLRRYLGGLVPWGTQLREDEDCRGAVLRTFSRGRVEPDERDVIVFAAVASQNHFCRASPGQYAALTVGRLETRWPRSQEERTLALLAYLNSSTASFWMRQHLYSKPRSGTRRPLRTADATAAIFDFGSKALERLPVPEAVIEAGQIREQLAECARHLESLAERHRRCAPQDILGNMEAPEEFPAAARHRWRGGSRAALVRALTWARHEEEVLFREMVVQQEEIDWLVYSALGLASLLPVQQGGALPEQRPFAWVEGESPADLAPELRKGWEERWRQRQMKGELQILDAKPYKRPWRSHQRTRRGELEDERVREACERWLLGAIELAFQRQATPTPMSVHEIAEALAATPDARTVAELLAGKLAPDMRHLLAPLIDAEAVPFLKSLRMAESGLEKSRSWEELWARERRGRVSVGDARRLAVPYDRQDFRSSSYWRLRGRLDFPRERFICYPGSDGGDRDQEVLFGWAGWTLLQQALVLKALYQARFAESWTPEHLLQILEGMEELLPWVQERHSEAAPGLEAFVNKQRSALGIERQP